MPIPASWSACAPPSAIAGVSANVHRLLMNGCSWQSLPDSGNTHRSRGTPSDSARSTEHMISAAAMSTSLLEFMYFGYGKPIIRLAGDTVRISSADFGSRIHALGLAAATALNLAHSSLILTWCSSTDSPAAARIAVSNIGYTWTGITIPRATSVGWFITSSSPSRRGVAPSGAFGQSNWCPALRARLRDRQASPPVRMARSRSPARISPAVRLTRLCALVAAVRGDRRLPRGQAEHLGDDERRIAVLPGQLVDDADRVRRGHGLQTGVARGALDRPGHQRRRVERVVDAGGAVQELAGTDEHGGTGIESHGATLRNGRGAARLDVAVSRVPRVARRRRGPRPPPRPTLARMTRIAIGADHAGFELKTHLCSVLSASGHDVVDLGTDSTEPVDYPPICAAVGRAVRDGEATFGVVVGGSGQGEQLAANKVHGVRAALCNDLYTARMARAHNDANVLSIGARVVGVGLAEEILLTFLATAFDGGRHAVRVQQIMDIEQAEARRPATTPPPDDPEL